MPIARPGLRRHREGSSSKHPPRRRTSAVSLSMTSMIDVLVVLTVFLLITFSAGESRAGRDVPFARNVAQLADAPVVDVRSGGMFVDGARVATHAELTAHLRRKRELAKQLAPGREPPDHVILAIDPEVPAAEVKAVVKSAADGGYPSIDFLVQEG